MTGRAPPASRVYGGRRAAAVARACGPAPADNRIARAPKVSVREFVDEESGAAEVEQPEPTPEPEPKPKKGGKK